MAKTALFENYQHTLVPALLFWMAGVLFASAHPVSLAFYGIWAGAGLLSLLLCLLLLAPRSVVRLFVWFLCFLLGGAYYAAFHFQPQSNDVSRFALGNPIKLEGVLVDYGRTKSQWVLAPSQLQQKDGNHPVSGQVMVHLRGSATVSTPLAIGQTVQVSGFLRKPQEAAFPGDFSYRDYLYQNKMTAVLFSGKATVLKQNPPTLWLHLLRFTDTIRQRINDTFHKAVAGAEGDILASVVLGDHAVGMERDVKVQFIRSGLVHVLAASGLNVGLIGAFFLGLGYLFRLPLRMTLLIAMAGVGFYCLLTGLPPSVMRAGAMFEIALGLKFLRQELRPVTLLGLAGVLLTLFNPMMVGMIGFQLSFMSSLGILVMVPPLQEKLGFYMTGWLADLLLVPVVAQLWVTPILAYTFHQVPLMSLPANLFALPLVTLLTYAGFVLGGLSLLIPQITAPVISLLWLPGMLLNRIAQFFASLSIGTLDIPAVPLPSVVALTATVFILAYHLHFPKRLLLKPALKAVTACLLIAVVPMSMAKWSRDNQTVVSWLSEGPSRSIQVVTLPQKTAIVTVQSLKPWSAMLITRYLKQQGIHRIQLLTIANPLTTRLDGLSLLSQTMPVEQVLFPKGLSQNATDELIAWSLKTHVPVVPVGDTYLVEGSGLRSTLYNIQNQETLIRFELGRTCFVNHWGVNAIDDSPLLPMAKGCQMVDEAGWLRFQVNNEPRRVRLDTFRQVVIAPDSIKIR